MSQPRGPFFLRPGRIARSRREKRLVRAIVGHLVSGRTGIAAFDTGPCQRCGALLVFGAGRGPDRLSTGLHSCARCLESRGPARELRFCELCGERSDALAARYAHAVCRSCIGRAPDRRLAGALADAALRRFVDRVCRTRNGLHNLRDGLELLAFEERLQGGAASGARAAHRRLLREAASSCRERGSAWSAPPAPEFDAPDEVRRLDVFVARVVRGGEDPLGREALLSVPRAWYLDAIEAVRRRGDEWSSRIDVDAVSHCRDAQVFSVLRVSDHLGRSAYALVRLREEDEASCSGIPTAGYPSTRDRVAVPYELVDVYGTSEQAGRSATLLVLKASREQEAGRSAVIESGESATVLQ